MATQVPSARKGLLLFLASCLLHFQGALAQGVSLGWDTSLNAVFYGGQNSGGSCGYGDTLRSIYSIRTVALSLVIYGDGAICGGCVVVQCINSRFCRPNKYVLATVTNSCSSTNASNPCYTGKRLVSLTPQAWDLLINSRSAGIVPVQIRRAPCLRQGGVQIFVQQWANRYFLAILIRNVGGPGDIRLVEYFTPRGFWIPMRRNYGAVWSLGGRDFGFRAVTIRITGGISPLTLVVRNALPNRWVPGTNYISKVNFPPRF